MILLQHILVVAALLFSVGLGVVLTKRNAIGVLIGIELMLNATNINLVAFAQNDPQKLSGQMTALFVIVVAVVESVVTLAIVLKVYQHFKTIDLEQIDTLKG